MLQNRLFAAGKLLLALSVCSAAFAAQITVNNHSFEDFAPFTVGCGVGCAYNNGPVPSWVGTGDFGSWAPGAPGNTTYFNVIPDGTVTAFAQGGTLRQTVTPTVQLGFTYTLLVDVGNRKDYAQTGLVALIVNGSTYAATSMAAPEGGWTTFVATYTGLAGDVGQSITILLNAPGGTNTQGNFDNVRLSDTAISTAPEPGTFALVGLGVALLALRRRC
jgi:hypothetical protein